MKKLTLLIMAAGVAACSQVETGEVGVKTSFGKIDGNALLNLVMHMRRQLSRNKLLSKMQTKLRMICSGLTLKLSKQW